MHGVKLAGTSLNSAYRSGYLDLSFKCTLLSGSSFFLCSSQGLLCRLIELNQSSGIDHLPADLQKRTGLD